MRIGAHVPAANPLTEAALRDAEVAQIFLSNPQSWAKPKPRSDADALIASDIDLVVHAPYILNVATTNNKVRIPSRSMLAAQATAAAAVGAKGLVVHGGHVPAGEDYKTGIQNWRKAFLSVRDAGGFATRILVENTAGGTLAMARHVDRLAELWDAIGEFDPGICLDTCHAHAGGEELLTLVDRVKAITGQIDLIHANDSKDVFGCGRDRHENIGKGQIDTDALCAVVSAANAPVIVETPGSTEGQRADIALLRERCATT